MGDINDGLHQLRMMFEERLHEVEYHKTSKNAVYQDYDKKKKNAEKDSVAAVRYGRIGERIYK